MNGQRALLVVAGLAGMLGVAMSAAGTHMPGGERLGIAGNMAMAQAPALLALGFFVPATARLMSIAAWAIALGLILFCGALAFHAISGSAALISVAPIGGTTMILGWLGVTIAALQMRKRWERLQTLRAGLSGPSRLSMRHLKNR